MRLINTNHAEKSYIKESMAIDAVRRLEIKYQTEFTVIMSINGFGRYVPMILPTEEQMQTGTAMAAAYRGFTIVRV